MVNHSKQGKINLYTESNDPEQSRRAEMTPSKVEGPNNQVWFVYIAQSKKTGRYYTGISPNPEIRIGIHNSGKGAKFAIDQGPMRLVYVSKKFPDKSTARKREIQIKGWRSEKKIWLIEGRIT